MEIKGIISIWFFIGLLLLSYGVIILISSFVVTPEQPTVLSEYRVGIWWGILLIIIGAIYTAAFRPGRQ